MGTVWEVISSHSNSHYAFCIHRAPFPSVYLYLHCLLYHIYLTLPFVSHISPISICIDRASLHSGNIYHSSFAFCIHLELHCLLYTFGAPLPSVYIELHCLLYTFGAPLSSVYIWSSIAFCIHLELHFILYT